MADDLDASHEQANLPMQVQSPPTTSLPQFGAPVRLTDCGSRQRAKKPTLWASHPVGAAMRRPPPRAPSCLPGMAAPIPSPARDRSQEICRVRSRHPPTLPTCSGRF